MALIARSRAWLIELVHSKGGTCLSERYTRVKDKYL